MTNRLFALHPRSRDAGQHGSGNRAFAKRCANAFARGAVVKRRSNRGSGLFALHPSSRDAGQHGSGRRFHQKAFAKRSANAFAGGAVVKLRSNRGSHGE